MYKVFWGTVLLIFGLALLLVPMIFKNASMHWQPAPAIVYSPAPKPPHHGTVNKSEPFVQQEYSMAMIPEKDWTDYVDKVVGWITTLAGAYVLVTSRRKADGKG